MPESSLNRTRVCNELKRSYQDARDLGLGLEHAAATLADAMAAAVPPAQHAQAQPPTLDALLDLDS
jgi:hypothetical protein